MPGPAPVPARVRRLSAGVLAAALLIPVTATAPAQAVTLSANQEQTAVTATADTKAPGLSSITRTTPEKVGPNESIRVQWTSEATDINYVHASFVNSAGQTITDDAYPGQDLVMNVDPQKIADGTYRLNYVIVYDVTGVETIYYGDGRVTTYPNGATPAPAADLNLDALTFTVQGTSADTKAPGLSSITRTTPEKVGPTESIRVQWTSEATDINYVHASFVNSAGQTITDDAYPGQDLVMNVDPQKIADGTYRLNYVIVYDVTGVETIYYGDGRVTTYPNGATPAPAADLNLDALTFTVQGTSADTKAPGLSSITRTTPEKVGPTESIRVQWTSEATDINYVHASFVNSAGQTITDDAYPGQDLVMNVDPQKIADGTYRLNYVIVYDVTGVETIYYGDGRVTTYPNGATPAPAADLNLDALTFTVQAASPEVTPAAVVFTDEDGTAADTYTVPATEGVDYLLNGEVVAAGTYPGAGTVEITARTQTGFVLAEGVTTSWTTSFKTTPLPVTPAAVTFADENGTAADTYTIPDTDGVDYLVNGTVTASGTYPGTGTVTVTARAKTDYVLADGADISWSNTFASIMAVTPAAPVLTDKPSTYTIPATTGVQYYVNGAATAPGTYKVKGTGTVEITARAQDGYVLTKDATTSWKKTFKKSPIHVTPGTVVFTDEKGTAADTYTIPDTEGVDYLVNGTVTAPGTYPGTGTVKVKTKAQAGYVLNGPGTWKTTFKR